MQPCLRTASWWSVVKEEPIGGVEFDPSRVGVLLFSRGRGSGHAIPDIAIVEELRKLRDDVDLRFVSYATGADTLTERGHNVIDLNLPERNPVLETMVRAAKVIARLRPQLVVSHEEFGALPAAKIFDLPAVMITDWFVEPEKFSMQTLQYADEIVFIDDPGIFEEPRYVAGRVQYVGPVLRPFEYSRADRERARRELDLPDDAVVISVLPGNWATEAREPVYDLLMPAFQRLEAPKKNLIWIAGADQEMLAEKTNDIPGVLIREKDWRMDRLMVASDLAITKTNRKTSMELAALGIPSISLSNGSNPVNVQRLEHIPTNRGLVVEEIDSEGLRLAIEASLSGGREAAGRADSDIPLQDGRIAAAERLALHIERVKSRASDAE